MRDPFCMDMDNQVQGAMQTTQCVLIFRQRDGASLLTKSQKVAILWGSLCGDCEL